MNMLKKMLPTPVWNILRTVYRKLKSAKKIIVQQTILYFQKRKDRKFAKIVQKNKKDKYLIALCFVTNWKFYR